MHFLGIQTVNQLFITNEVIIDSNLNVEADITVQGEVKAHHLTLDYGTDDDRQIQEWTDIFDKHFITDFDVTGNIGALGLKLDDEVIAKWSDIGHQLQNVQVKGDLAVTGDTFKVDNSYLDDYDAYADQSYGHVDFLVTGGSFENTALMVDGIIPTHFKFVGTTLSPDYNIPTSYNIPFPKFHAGMSPAKDTMTLTFFFGSEGGQYTGGSANWEDTFSANFLPKMTILKQGGDVVTNSITMGRFTISINDSSGMGNLSIFEGSTPVMIITGSAPGPYTFNFNGNVAQMPSFNLYSLSPSISSRTKLPILPAEHSSVGNELEKFRQRSSASISFCSGI
jgi:hypothetical protein